MSPGETTDGSQNPNTPVAGEGTPAAGSSQTKGRDAFLSARDQMLADLDAKVLARREEETGEYLRSADPRAAALYAEMNREAAGLPLSTEGGQPAADPATRPIEQDARSTAETDAGDPLADYIVRQPGKPPMFRAVVNGRTVLMPLEDARAQIQKHGNADVRLQEVARREKELQTREGLAARQAQLRPTESRPITPAMDDAALERESAELVRSLVSEPEAVAAKKMAATLKKLAQPAPVNPDAIVQRAVSTAVQTIAAQDQTRALQDGFKQFQQTYPEIAKDSDLFALADRRTDAIAKANPGWTPTQVMLEAGKQTRDWLAARTGRPAAQPTAPNQPNARQQAKQQLRPMPASRIATPVADEPGEDNSPQAAVAALRKARGQAY